MNIVVFEKVSKTFEGYIHAIKVASFEIPRGVVAGLLGPNGSGKTTSFKLILGFLKPDKGKIRVFDMDPWVNEVEVRRKIGYLPEKPFYPRTRVDKFLRYIAKVRGASSEDVKRIVKLVGIGKYWLSEVSSLSRGYLQRLGLAQALIGDPELLLLDEPTANLDPHARREILGLIKDLGRELGLTIIIATHILPEMQEVADYIVFINKGVTAEYGPIDILTKQYRVDAYYLVYTGRGREIAPYIVREEYVKGIEFVREGLIVRIDSSYSDVFEELIKNRFSEHVSGYKLVTGELHELYEKLSKIF